MSRALLVSLVALASLSCSADPRTEVIVTVEAETGVLARPVTCKPVATG